MTIEEFKARNTVVAELERRGHRVPNGKHPSIKCPFHEDKNPSFSIDVERGLWNCHAGCGGGDLIRLIARFENCTDADVLKRYVPRDETPTTPQKPRIEKIYSYQDSNGKEVYQVCRMVPKTFRQRHQVNGQWVWNMEDVERVLYRLPEVLRADCVWIVEGEKDADNLSELGFCATCNVGGAGKWMDGYTEALTGKEVVLCGDNDKPGIDHMEKVFASIGGKVKSARRVTLPGDFKDVSDYIAAFTTPEEASAALTGLMNAAMVLIKGIHVPVYSLAELERTYREHIRNLESDQLQLGRWLPQLGLHVRPLVPGEIVTVLASTGVGKTAILQNIAKNTFPLPTILFEMELPPELVYERFLGVIAGWSPTRVEQTFKAAVRDGQEMGELEPMKHIFVCTEPKMTPERLEQYILRSELRIGQKPKVVMLDYIQLVDGKGRSRYEKISSVAEELKIVAKSTRTILFVASQIHRKEGEDPSVNLFDAKDSGSIENSSGLVLGAWRNPNDKTTMHIKILKNTKGTAGSEITCNFIGESMQIKQASRMPDYEDS